MTISESSISRPSMLAAAAIGGTLTATALANAETVDQLSEPRRPGRGGSNPGPKNPGRIQQNPDMIAPPATDHGTLPNLRFSFDDSHTRIEPGGWTRQVTVRELGISKNIAGVNMRLNAGGVREPWILEPSATGYANRICTSLPSSLRIAWKGVLKPRHFLGVRLAVMTMS